jgi:RimJ/RimL family protein N-acetyltransferase
MAEDDRLGRPVPQFAPPRRPDGIVLTGAHVRVEPLRAEAHAAAMFAATAGHHALWDYMPYGPFADAEAYAAWVRLHETSSDPVFFAIIDRASAICVGVASFLRIAPEAGSIEIGHICLSPALQRSIAATEMQFLMMAWAFSAGYRRYEWKCNALNLPSRRAAERLGLSFEGVFRNHLIVKGRNRDTAWFAATDADWPALAEAFRRWLQPANFDAAGRQVVALADLTRPHLVTRDPAVLAAG